MWFRLALQMGRTVAELQQDMTSAEFSEWLAFSSLEPFGYFAESQGPALVACTIANVNRGKDNKPYKVEDFMPHDPKPPQSANQMKQFATMLTLALGGTVKE